MRTTFRRFLIKSLGAVAVATVALTSTAQAQTFVGSWSVYNMDAPTWTCCEPNGPLAYTGQEAAALLFGGIPSDYIISTVSNQVADINFSAWYDVIGFGSLLAAQNYDNKYLDEFYGPTNGYSDGNNADNAASAFVRDNLAGFDGVNYAFRANTVVPEPSTVVLSGFGLLALGAAARRRRAQA
jgi:hypothetical protein